MVSRPDMITKKLNVTIQTERLVVTLGYFENSLIIDLKRKTQFSKIA